LECFGVWQMLRSEEVELLVCGNPSLDIRELRRVAVYDGFTADDETIRYAQFLHIIVYLRIHLKYLFVCTSCL